MPASKLIKPGFVPERVLFDMGYSLPIPFESQDWFKMPDFHYPVPKSMPDEKGEEMTVRISDDGIDGESGEEIENDRQFGRWMSGWEVV